MSTQGTTTIDFGSFPGQSNIALVITGQSGIGSGALVDAWLMPADTADHTVDEHVIDGPVVMAGAVVAGTGFTIYAQARDGLAWGQWNVAWVWNN